MSTYIIMVGKPGIGKTRILKEITALLKSKGINSEPTMLCGKELTEIKKLKHIEHCIKVDL